MRRSPSDVPSATRAERPHLGRRAGWYTGAVGARFLDDAARDAFRETIEELEGSSAVEVVVALRRRSAGYLHANLIVGLVVAFAGLAVMLFSPYPFSLLAILLDPFVVGAGAGALVELLPQVKRLLTPAKVRRRHVAHAAHAAFVERGVHNTIDRSGLLVYISWLEREVALVADWNLEQAYGAEALRRAAAALTQAMPGGGVAVARALAALGADMAAAMPRRDGDLNELPDALDSDLPAPPRRPSS